MRTASPSPAISVNEPFRIDDYIAPSDTTCPAPGMSAPNGVPKGSGLPGGCTRDLVHRFYQEQYQLNGGRQNRYVTGSDAVGLAMGYYDTRQLPIYRYLHERGHPRYVISDRFFQAAFGGSFLNHQWLIAAASPVFQNARSDGSADDLHSLVDANGMPTSYPLYRATGPVKDAALTVPCSSPRPAGLACGDFAVNTIQPFYQPYAPGTAEARRLPPQEHATIGDRLSAKGIDWAWYSGGWSNANGDVGGPGWTNGSTPGTCTDPQTATGAVWPNCPNKLFQYHHQSFNYFKAYAPGTRARRQHLRDEEEFEALAADSRRQCRLKPVSLIKPIGAENEHPGYASEHTGSDHLVDLLTAVQHSRCAQRHDGHRHLRRIRRPMGPRPAAGPRHHHARTARRDGTQHPNPRADHRAGPAPILRRRPRLARHHLDHGHDRAPLPPAARVVPRRHRPGPLDGIRPPRSPARPLRRQPSTRTAAPRGRPSHLSAAVAVRQRMKRVSGPATS